MNSGFARVPALAEGVRLRADARSGWFLHATEERGIRLNDRAAATIGLFDGVRSIADIARVLRKTYSGGIDTLDADVLVLVRVLLGRGLALWRAPATAVAR